MRRPIIITTLLALCTVAGALVYQAAARDRDYRALLSRGDVALVDEQAFSAIEAYSGAIALRPESMLAHLRRAETYQRRGDRGDLDQAARDFRRAAALDPTAPRPLEEMGDVLYQLRRYRQAAETYAECFRLDDRSARVSYKQALASYATGDLDATISTLNQTLRLGDQMVDAQYLLGMSLRGAGRRPEALQAFERAIQLSPGLIAAREELADLYGSSRRHDDELEQLQVLAALDRDRAERHVAVGLAQARAGHADLAVLTLGSVLERAPNQPLIYRALGQVWLEIAQARDDVVALRKALEALGRAATSPGATSDILTLYGRALLLDKQTDLAERTLRQATERYPLEPSALFWYATAAERLGHVVTARDLLVQYDGLIGDDGDRPSRAARIGALSVGLGDPQAAVAWFAVAADTEAADGRLLASLADAQLKAGDPVAARATVTRGLSKEPENRLLLGLARRLR